MSESYLLDTIQILISSKHSLKQETVFIRNGQIKAFGKEAHDLGKKSGVKAQSAKEKILAPCLVDPHSILENPLNGQNETLYSLQKNASKGGYGRIAILPKSVYKRESPEHFKLFGKFKSEVLIDLWANFSNEDEKKALSPHSELIRNGAIGLAGNTSDIPVELIKQGLLLGEMKDSPVLFAPQSKEIQGNGLVRECVETLRAGWPPDPAASETVPLCQLLELHRQHPEIAMRLMNISTYSGVEILGKIKDICPIASTSWWHLIADTSNLTPPDIGWRVSPSLGSPKDRENLIRGLEEGILKAIGVNSIALNDAEMKKPSHIRSPGVSGYKLVLPLLWEELVVKANWQIEKLWEVLSFGPSRMLNIQEEKLSIGSNRWLLFDPNQTWTNTIDRTITPNAMNQPFEGKSIQGKVIDCGLKAKEDQTY